MSAKNPFWKVVSAVYMTLAVSVLVASVNELPDPVLHLPFNNNSVGDWPHKVNGELKWADGKFGQALLSDGKNSVVIERSFVGLTGSGTYSCWIKWNGSIPTGGCQFILTEMVANNPCWALVLFENSAEIGFYYQKRFDKPEEGLYVKTIPPKAGEWTHVAVAFTEAFTRIYVNGKLQVEGPAGGANQALGHKFCVGAGLNENWTPGFTGLVDDVRVYQKPLNEEDVQKLYQQQNDEDHAYREKTIYVAPGGSVRGEGTKSDPTTLDWAIRYAMAGDTVLLLPGYYVSCREDGKPQQFSVSVRGTKEKPIVFRPAVSEELYPVVIDTGLRGAAPYTTFEGLEIASSLPRPPDNLTNPEQVKLLGTELGLHVSGDEVCYINNIIHNLYDCNCPCNGGGEIYGNIMYNLGRKPLGGLQPHAWYIHNKGDVPLRIERNIIFETHGYPLHIYTGTGQPLENIEVRENVLFLSGYRLSNGRYEPVSSWAAVIVWGGTPKNITLDRNIIYGNSSDLRGMELRGITRVRITGNYVVDGAIHPKDCSDMVIADNTLIGTKGSTALEIQSPRNDGSPANYAIDRNAYCNVHFVVGHTDAKTGYKQVGYYREDPECFAKWKVLWGMDQNSKYMNELPKGTEVTLLKNKYDPARLDVIVRNWDRLDSVEVDLGGFLKEEDQYIIYDVLDLNRKGVGAFKDVTPVAQGKFSGEKVTLPLKKMQGKPDLDVFILFRKSMQGAMAAKSRQSATAAPGR